MCLLRTRYLSFTFLCTIPDRDLLRSFIVPLKLFLRLPYVFSSSCRRACLITPLLTPRPSNLPRRRLPPHHHRAPGKKLRARGTPSTILSDQPQHRHYSILEQNCSYDKMSASQYPIPSTPRVISPSPTPSEKSGKDYFTRSSISRKSSSEPIAEDAEHPDLSRARSRSRSPGLARKGSRRLDGMTPIPEKTKENGVSKPTRRKPESAASKKGGDGYLKPSSAGFGKEYWRALSRSPSPLGLIPIHREWRTFVSRSSAFISWDCY